MTSFNEVFESVKKYCTDSGKIGETAHKLWIQTLEPVKLDLDTNTAVFFVNSEFQKKITLDKYENLLKEAFAAVLGFDVEINITTQDDIKTNEIENEKKNIEERKLELAKSFENAEYDYTFDTFIVGRSNEFAYAACTAVANSKNGSTYNPLFIHGPSTGGVR